LLVRVEFPRDSKVTKLQDPVVSYEDILALNVPVKDIFGVHDQNGQHDLGKVRNNLLRAEPVPADLALSD
jgi:hypothetical protein